MEDVMISGIGGIASYGALGAVAVYFMVKDWLLSSKINDALKDFTIAVNLMAARLGDK